MKRRDILLTAAIFLGLQVLCATVTVAVLRIRHLSREDVDWGLPALFAYAFQAIFSIILVRGGRRSLVSNLLRSSLALILSLSVMGISSYILYRGIHRIEFQGVDYFAAVVIYLLAVPGQLVVMIGGPLLLRFCNVKRPIQNSL